jgi:hypothetical protein
MPFIVCMTPIEVTVTNFGKNTPTKRHLQKSDRAFQVGWRDTWHDEKIVAGADDH